MSHRRVHGARSSAPLSSRPRSSGGTRLIGAAGARGRPRAGQPEVHGRGVVRRVELPRQHQAQGRLSQAEREHRLVPEGQARQGLRDPHQREAEVGREPLEDRHEPQDRARRRRASKCLVCHAVDVKPELRGPKFDITEGVHCDGCHGPAEKWLEPHAEKGWTHEQSVKVGMYDTKNFLLRAEKCVSCHLQIEPRWWRPAIPTCWPSSSTPSARRCRRTGATRARGRGTKAWATGQVISLREAAKQLEDRASGNASAALLTDALGKVQGHGAVVRVLLGVAAPDAQKSVRGRHRHAGRRRRQGRQGQGGGDRQEPGRPP